MSKSGIVYSPYMPMMYMGVSSSGWKFLTHSEWVDWARAIINRGLIEVQFVEEVAANGYDTVIRGYCGRGKVYSMLSQTVPIDMRFYVCGGTGTVYLEDRVSCTILAIKTLED